MRSILTLKYPVYVSAEHSSMKVVRTWTLSENTYLVEAIFSRKTGWKDVGRVRLHIPDMNVACRQYFDADIEADGQQRLPL
jgi:hypothetical protein